jgi:hypothetical protein
MEMDGVGDGLLVDVNIAFRSPEVDVNAQNCHTYVNIQLSIPARSAGDDDGEGSGSCCDDG